MEVRGIEERMEHIIMMLCEGSFAEMVGGDGNING